jgi:Retinal pigment epithelial membrane protein
MQQRPKASIDLYVRGRIPEQLRGVFLVASSRRHKDRGRFSRWHDSQADLLRLEVSPGSPGKVSATVVEVDPSGRSLGNGFSPNAYENARAPDDAAYGYATQPNHGLNVSGDRVWATNLLFGAPLELDLNTWQPKRVLRFVEPSVAEPRVSSSAHFAWNRDKSVAYFHQSTLSRETQGRLVESRQLTLIRLDLKTGDERTWAIIPPHSDQDLRSMNFHSAFWWKESGSEYVGLLKTGAIIEELTPHTSPNEHYVEPMQASTIWYMKIDETAASIKADILPGLDGFFGIAMSHLDVRLPDDDTGFVLFANCKQSDVAEETHGVNYYGQDPHRLTDHYSGFVAEPFNVGSVIRYERRGGKHDVRILEQAYDSSLASQGHTWLPINVNLDASGQSLFCSFAGFRPRLLPQHVLQAYKGRAVDMSHVRFVPPLIMKLDPNTLRPQRMANRGHLAYSEPLAMTVVGDSEAGFLCTFSPEQGLRILRAGDMNVVEAYATNHELWSCGETHFRPDPPHMTFVPS